MFAEKTADVQLLSLLREALGARDENGNRMERLETGLDVTPRIAQNSN
jgi:hypothetical protein